MAHDSEQKIKLLVLYNILCKMTDENHALNTDEIIAELAKHNIKESRRVLPSDIALLNAHGYEVLSLKKKYHYYYVVNHQFDTAEIAMLADVVKASKLSLGQKDSLIQKLTQTVGEHQAEILPKHIISGDTPRRSNKHIMYSIDTIENALNEGKKVSFLYYSLDAKKNKVYRKDGKKYVVNPLVMVWNKDNYYLLCYHDNYEGTTTYRIDRMENVEIEETPITVKAEFEGFDIEAYRSQVFSMFGGEIMTVELEFTEEMLDDMYDKFGEQINIQEADDKYRVTVPIQISPNFFSWIVGSRGKVRICFPRPVLKQFDEFVQKIKEEY